MFRSILEDNSLSIHGTMNIEDLLKAVGLGNYLYNYPVETAEKLKKAKSEGEYIPLAKLTAITFAEEVEKQIHRLIRASETGIIREDLLFAFHALVTRSIKSKQLLEDFKEVMLPKHYEALIFADTLVTLENKTFSDKVTELRKKFRKKFELTGDKIYNIHRSGYMTDFFHFQLGMFKWMNPGTYPEKFRDFFNEHLEFYPDAIWVGESMTRKELEDEIKVRLELKSISKVHIYARGADRVKFVEDVCEDYITFRKGLIRMKERYSLGANECTMITILKTPKSKSSHA